MDVNELKIRLVNKYCDEVKDKQNFTELANNLKGAIESLDEIMLVYFGKVFNSDTLRYE